MLAIAFLIHDVLLNWIDQPASVWSSDPELNKLTPGTGTCMACERALFMPPSHSRPCDRWSHPIRTFNNPRADESRSSVFTFTREMRESNKLLLSLWGLHPLQLNLDRQMMIDPSVVLVVLVAVCFRLLRPTRNGSWMDVAGSTSNRQQQPPTLSLVARRRRF
jgi:hypothetical protein